MLVKKKADSTKLQFHRQVHLPFFKSLQLVLIIVGVALGCRGSVNLAASDHGTNTCQR